MVMATSLETICRLYTSLAATLELLKVRSAEEIGRAEDAEAYPGMVVPLYKALPVGFDGIDP